MRRRLKKLGGWLIALVVLLLGLAGAGLLYLRSAAGGELVRRQVVEGVNGAIAGKLEIGSATLWGETVVLENLRLYTPEGELVAEVKRLEATGDVLGLLRGEVRLSDAKVDGPTLLLVRDARGLNLSRAVAARVQSSASGNGPPPQVTVEVGALALSNGRFEYSEAGRQVRLLSVGGKGHANVRTPPLELLGEVELNARAEGPVEGPLVARATAKPGAAKGSDVSLFVQGAGLSADASLDLGTELLTVRTLDVAPTLGRAVLGEAWPTVAAHLTGRAGLKRADLELVLDGAGRGTVRADYDLDALQVDHLEVAVEDIDLSQLRAGLPATRLSAKVSGSIPDARPASLSGILDVSGAWREPDGARVGEVSAHLTATHGVVTLEPVTAELPGARLSVKGTASAKLVELDGHLAAEDAGRAGRTLAHAAGVEIPALSAAGTLDVNVVGALLRPTIMFSGKLKTLALGELSAAGIDVAFGLPNLARWREADGNFAAARITVGEITLESVQLNLVTKGRDVSLDVSSKGLTALKASATGRLEGDNALALATVALEWPGTNWTMEAPSRLSWARGVDLEPVRLRSGPQALDVEFHQHPGTFSGRLGLTAVDVAKLPVAFVPPSLELAGQLSGTATVEGTQRAPRFGATLEWKQGRIRMLEGIDGTAEAHFEGGRAKGTLAASTRLGAATGTFDVPLLLGKAPADAQISVTVQLDGLALDRVLTAAGTTPQLEGSLRLGAALQGTVGDLRLALDASTLGAVWKPGAGRSELQLHSAALLVETRADGTPAAQLELTTLGGTARLDATTPRKLTDLLWHPPDARAARELPWSADFSASGFSLLALRSLLPEALAQLEGTAQGTAHADGPYSSPALSAQVRLADFSSPDFRPVQLALDFNGTPAATAAEFKATLQDKTLVQLKASTSLLLHDVLERAIDPGQRLAVEANIGPLELADVATLRRKEQGVFSGQVRASLDVSGTLGDPKLGLRGSLERLKLGKVTLGKANLGWDYGATKSTATLAMVSSNGGQLRARGALTLDLSLKALQAGLGFSEAPVQASLTARGFDLAFLSGAHASLRSIGGQVTADGSVDGKLGSPTYDGQLAWTQGRLGIAGTSEFRDLELAVTANNERISVEKLTGRSGSGTLALHGESRRQSRALWAFTGGLTTERLPVVLDDQLRCILDVRAELEGESTDLLWNVKRLEIPEAHVLLPEIRKKDIQALDRPKDIVLVRDGLALGPKPRRWKKTAEETLAAAAQQLRERVVRATVVAPKNLWVKSTDVSLEVGLSDGFEVEYDHQLTLNGEVHVQQGRVDVIGRRFDVENGSSVRFNGNPSTPYLNVTAVHVNEREQVTVFASLVGSGSDFSFKTTSQPALSESEIFTLLATGHKTLKRGSGSAMSAEQAVSVVGAYVGNQIKTAISQKLPIDVLDVLSIEAGGEGFRGTRIEAGKYLSDRLYLGYIGQIGADRGKGENNHAGRIEFQFAPGWSVQATGGDAPAGSADVVWGLDF